MVQVKKASVRNAILDAAFDLLSRKGYAETTLADIAREAGITPANIYRYYDSKLALMQAVGVRWAFARFEALERRLKRIKDPQVKLRTLLVALWKEIPESDNGFSTNLVEAIASRTSGESFSATALPEWERRLSTLLRDCLPTARRHLAEPHLLPHLAIMAYDGFALGIKMRGESAGAAPIVELMCELLLGRSGAARSTIAARQKRLTPARRVTPPRSKSRRRPSTA